MVCPHTTEGSTISIAFCAQCWQRLHGKDVESMELYVLTACHADNLRISALVQRLYERSRCIAAPSRSSHCSALRCPLCAGTTCSLSSAVYSEMQAVGSVHQLHDELRNSLKCSENFKTQQEMACRSVARHCHYSERSRAESQKEGQKGGAQGEKRSNEWQAWKKAWRHRQPAQQGAVLVVQCKWGLESTGHGWAVKRRHTVAVGA